MPLLVFSSRLRVRFRTTGRWGLPFCVLVLLAGGLVATLPAQAQDDPGAVQIALPGGLLEFGGTLQPRVSYGVADGGDAERVGFGLRRARFRADAFFGERYGVHYDVGLGSGRLTSIDLFVFYAPTPSLRIRGGLLPVAQPRAFVFTPMTRIDAVDRPAIADHWASNTIGGRGRDFGVSMEYSAGGATVELSLHNGSGSFDRAEGNFRETVIGFQEGPTLPDLAAGAYVSYEPTAVPGFEIGGYTGYNGSRNANTAPEGGDAGRRYVSYSGHLYWGAEPGSQPFRFKADVIGVRYESIRSGGTRFDEQHTIGGAVLGAARMTSYSEVFARYERLYADLDMLEGDYVTAGLSYSPSARRGAAYWRERFTLAYTNALPDEGATVHLVVFQAQLSF